jgi:hypothetical protein
VVQAGSALLYELVNPGIQSSRGVRIVSSTLINFLQPLLAPALDCQDSFYLRA